MRWVLISIVLHLALLLFPFSNFQQNTDMKSSSIKIDYEFKNKAEKTPPKRKILKEELTTENLPSIKRSLSREKQLVRRKMLPLRQISYEEKIVNDNVGEISRHSISSPTELLLSSPRMKGGNYPLKTSPTKASLIHSSMSENSLPGKNEIAIMRGKKEMITYGIKKDTSIRSLTTRPSPSKIPERESTNSIYAAEKGSHPGLTPPLSLHQGSRYSLRSSSPKTVSIEKEEPTRASPMGEGAIQILTIGDKRKKEFSPSISLKNISPPDFPPSLQDSLKDKTISVAWKSPVLTSHPDRFFSPEERRISSDLPPLKDKTHSPAASQYVLFTEYTSQERSGSLPVTDEPFYSRQNIAILDKNKVPEFSTTSKKISGNQRSPLPPDNLLSGKKEEKNKSIIFSASSVPLRASSLDYRDQPVPPSLPSRNLPYKQDILDNPRDPIIDSIPSRTIEDYIRKIREYIQKHKQYPSLARREGKHGRVGISFRLFRNGKVTDIKVLSSSEHSELDKAAKNLIYKLSPFPPFPEKTNKKSITLKMEVVYELEEKS